MEGYKTRIIICDDHALFRLGVETALSGISGTEVAGSASSAEELLELLKHTPADLILLDIILPGMSGVDAVPLIKAGYPAVRILILSVDSSQQAIEKALEGGVDGFISKTAPVAEMAGAVDSIARGYQYYGRDIARIIRDINDIRPSAGQVKFTQREQEIIALCGEGFFCKEIADKLGISPRTVDTHKTNIFRKLGINNSVELIRYAAKTGLLTF